ncbi:hypothetical protein OG422_14555 [Streptomyces sp. NBC_01525]|uniref:hypothetical protein n=1 Tax=Streptomyces sp. NBC_01525 TaxID=2903893 RepID=UPI003866ADDA
MDLAENAAAAATAAADRGDGPGFTAAEAARAALRAGVRLPTERHAAVAAVAHHLHTVLGPLRELSDACVRLCAPANITGIPALTCRSARTPPGCP